MSRPLGRLGHAVFGALLLTVMADRAQAQLPLSLAERRVLESWLLCIDCGSAELDSLLALAARKPAATVDSLRINLLRGPADQVIVNMRQKFAAVYDSVLAGDPVTASISSTDYVAHYVRSLNTVWRRRAALGLAHVGGQAALSALNAGLDSSSSGSANFGPRVRATLTFARDSLWTP